MFEGALGRFSYVGVGGGAPRLTIRAGKATGGVGLGQAPLPAAPFEAIRTALDQLAYTRRDDLPPFCGGLAGYLGWGACRFTEKIPERLGPDPLFPDCDLLVVRELVAFDHRQGRCWAIATGSESGEASPEKRAERLAGRVLRVFGNGSSAPLSWPDALRSPAARSLARELGANKGGRNSRALSVDPQPMAGGEKAFLASVRRALEYIRAGDVFQVVLSQRFELPDCDGFSLYRTLRAASPAPFHFYLRLAGRELFGASPELLVQVERGEMTLRPIAGTRPRGKTFAEDQQHETDLLADPKERAEHTMLVDLGRNDVGRVSEIGSVKVTRLMEIERYSHVMHLTSEVTGRLREGLDGLSAFSAAFPAGTLSGAPKIRALEIIDELEGVPRGPYGGAVGWLSGAGDVQLAIAIRTLFRSEGRLFAHAGAGIVADSDPKSEWREVLAKARAAVGAAYGAAARGAP